MLKCQIKECSKPTPYRNSKNPYCHMHMARFRRNGYFEKKTGSHGLEKLPHKIVDGYILKNYWEMLDKEIAQKLKEKGFKDATIWNIRYRRRQLGIKKYLYGEVLKHRAWIRLQAIKKYGEKCELCGYNMAVETHHILPRHQRGPHQVDNLTVICPNCHSLITRGKLTLQKRDDIPKVRKQLLVKLKKFYDFL